MKQIPSPQLIRISDPALGSITPPIWAVGSLLLLVHSSLWIVLRKSR